MSRLLVIILGLGLLIGFTNCDSASSSANEGTAEETNASTSNPEGGTAAVGEEDKKQVRAMQETPPPASAAEPQGLTVSNTSFAGIQPGDEISTHSDRVKATVMRNGEGTFDVYAIFDANGQQLGYAQPNMKDEKLLGDIVITSPKAITADGIRIGMTYGELRSKYPNIEVHGSEVEGRTYAMRGNIYYRLNVANSKFNLDPNSIDNGVKITEITLSRAE